MKTLLTFIYGLILVAIGMGAFAYNCKHISFTLLGVSHLIYTLLGLYIAFCGFNKMDKATL